MTSEQAEPLTPGLRIWGTESGRELMLTHHENGLRLKILQDGFVEAVITLESYRVARIQEFHNGKFDR